MVQILQSLSYKECSIILPKFTTSGLFIIILGRSAIMDQTACCYVVTTLEIGLYYIDIDNKLFCKNCFYFS